MRICASIALYPRQKRRTLCQAPYNVPSWGHSVTGREGRALSRLVRRRQTKPAAAMIREPRNESHCRRLRAIVSHDLFPAGLGSRAPASDQGPADDLRSAEPDRRNAGARRTLGAGQRKAGQIDRGFAQPLLPSGSDSGVDPIGALSQPPPTGGGRRV